MSKNTDRPVIVTENGEPVETPKESFFRRNVVNPIKKHPKIAIAVAAGVTLVGAAAFLGDPTVEATDELALPTEDSADVPDTTPDES